jgi:hypothetical protein
VRDLIRQMSNTNPLWGAPRIHSELFKLGIEVSQATIGKVHGAKTWHAFTELADLPQRSNRHRSH